jgi:glucose-6-phosphate isomerase
MAVRALAEVAHPGLSLHFVANVDGADLASVLARVGRPRRSSSSPARPSRRRRR